uniref:Uncharacterized protein n=1 Tax=Euplotes harpa TaxID=151035 RepID=A0A7S3N6R5_9SPIT|mmetsp:Transcript_17443/g.20260  ORF Transcript_17443/g.20260 Transcript_17443/m.20260 type:complete len:281 (+) Transcript_17443:208-1050(+)
MSAVCGGSSDYRCSSQTSYLPQNAKKLLCPSDVSSCLNMKSLTEFTSGTSAVLFSNSIPLTSACSYKVAVYTSSIDSVTITVNALNKATFEVYHESSPGTFMYKSEVASGKSTTLDVNEDSSVWVLVTPTSAGGTVQFSIKGDGSSSPDKAKILIAVFCSVGGLILLILIIVGIICLIKRCKKKKSQSESSKVSAIVAPPVSSEFGQYTSYHQVENQSLAAGKNPSAIGVANIHNQADPPNVADHTMPEYASLPMIKTKEASFKANHPKTPEAIQEDGED